MGEVVEDVADVMKIPGEAATALLRHFSWNKEKLFDQFYKDPDSVMQRVGITESCVAGSSMGAAEMLRCNICTEEGIPGSDAYALPCGHFFCNDCWRGYLEAKVGDGPTCVYTTCPAHKCPLIVSESLFHKFAAAAAAAKYDQYALNSFVDINKKLRQAGNGFGGYVGYSTEIFLHVQ
ncbi:unnamed protein product [Phaeothamnion confervicola]